MFLLYIDRHRQAGMTAAKIALQNIWILEHPEIPFLRDLRRFSRA
jgi:hypothetical protein